MEKLGKVLFTLLLFLTVGSSQNIYLQETPTPANQQTKTDDQDQGEDETENEAVEPEEGEEEEEDAEEAAEEATEEKDEEEDAEEAEEEPEEEAAEEAKVKADKPQKEVAEPEAKEDAEEPEAKEEEAVEPEEAEEAKEKEEEKAAEPEEIEEVKEEDEEEVTEEAEEAEEKDEEAAEPEEAKEAEEEDEEEVTEEAEEKEEAEEAEEAEEKDEEEVIEEAEKKDEAEEKEEEVTEEAEEKEEEEVTEEAEEVEEEAPEEAEEDAEDERPGISVRVGITQILLNSPFLDLLKTTLGNLVPKINLAKKIDKLRAKIKSLGDKIKTKGLRIPLIGKLKFEDYKGTEKIDGALPLFVAKLYDKTGKTEKILKMGPLTVKKFNIFFFSETKIPRIRADVTLLKHAAKLIQKKYVAGKATFLLTLEKALKIPLGIKKRLPIKEFTMVLSGAERFISTQVKLFGTKAEALSDIKLDLTQPPFPFKVKARNIPITALSSALKLTPLRNLMLRKLDLHIGLLPISIKLYGEADMKKVKLGLTGKDMSARVSGKLGSEGFNFIFELKNLKLPLKMGIIHKAQLRIGAS